MAEEEDKVAREEEDDDDDEEEEEEEGEEDNKEEEVQDLRNSDVITKYKMASDIANKTMDGVLKFCKPGQKVVAVCALGDTLINKQVEKVFKSKKIEKGVAFPTCVSINDTVCHYSPLNAESKVVEEGDVVKVDLAVHLDGYIVTAAHTFVATNQETPPQVTGKTADVILAAYYAAEAAVKLIKPGAKNSTVTETIAKVAECYGVKPVQGVLMHQMKRFVIDGNQVIIGREETDQKVEPFEFEESQVYTVDIVMSTGEGKPIEREARTTVFKRAVDQSYRLKMKASRYVFNQVNKSFPTLPFTIRVLDDEKQARMGVVECVKHGLLYPYPVLYEKAGDIVAHFKYTLLLLPSGTIKVTGLPLDVTHYQSDKTLSQEIQDVLSRSSKTKKKKKKKKKSNKEGEDATPAPDEAPAPEAP